jgi:VanZ family protein
VADVSFSLLTTFVAYWGPVLVYMGLIGFSSSRARPDLLSAAPDYLLHGLAYAGLAMLSVRALAKRTLSGLSRAHLLGGALIAALYGISDELHQLRVPGREGSLSDVAADFLGAAFGAAFLAALSVLSAEGETR